MSQLDLRSIFEELSPPGARSADTLAVSATPVPGLPSHRIGKDSENGPVLLVAVSGFGQRPPDVRLQNLSVMHDARCRVWHGGAPVEEGTFTVIRCPAESDSVRQYFLLVAVPFLLALGDRPSAARVSQLVDGIVQLFQALSEPPHKSVQGIWAELFLMEQASDTRVLARAWHVRPDEKYDFSAGTERLEVKSASGRQRRHTFSLDQLEPPAPATVLVASVLMQRAGGGTSLADVAGRIRAKLAAEPELVFRVDTVLGLTLGEGLPFALEERYDEQLALESLAYFDSRSIPRPEGEVPREVSDVRFSVDMSGLTPIDISVYSSGRHLYAAAAPR